MVVTVLDCADHAPFEVLCRPWDGAGSTSNMRWLTAALSCSIMTVCKEIILCTVYSHEPMGDRVDSTIQKEEVQLDTQTKIADLKPATEPNTYYLLFLVNHKTREFMLRVEDTPGTGRHSIQWFAAHGMDRLVSGYAMPGWIQERYQWVVANCKDLEQSVIATVDAVDSKSAREQIKQHRRNIAKSLSGIGYRPYNK